MTNLTGLVGVVTGASSGIGEVLAKMLAAEGVKVAIKAWVICPGMVNPFEHQG